MTSPSSTSPADRSSEGNLAAAGSTRSDRPVLDLRELPPPEPLQRALEAVTGLQANERLVVLTRFRPAHLIDQLDARGCAYECVSRGAEGWQVTLWRRS